MHSFSRYSVLGHEAEEVIHMTNNEGQSFRFDFEESSLYCAGYSAGLVVDPAAGTIPAKSTYVFPSKLLIISIRYQFNL